MAGERQKWTEVADLPALPGDILKKDFKGTHNESLEQRRLARAEEILKEFAKQLPGKKPNELIEMFCVRYCVEGGVAHYLAFGGNKLIKAELKSRGEAARQALEAHRNDTRFLYAGSSGWLFDSIGRTCQGLLEELDGRNPKPEPASHPARP